MTTTWFEYFIMTAIAVNTLVMMLEYDGQPQMYGHVLNMANVFFTVVFLAEAVLKIIALGFKG